MQSVLEIATPVCRDIGGVTTELHRLRAAVTDVARQNGSARRLGRHAPLQPVRAAAHHHSRPLPRARRPAQYVARRELIFGMPSTLQSTTRRKRSACSAACSSTCPSCPRSAPRHCSGEASRRASPRHGSCLRSVPAFRPPPALPRLRRLRARRGPAGAPAASPTTRTSGGTSVPTASTIEIRICDAVTRVGLDRHRRFLPGARQASLRALRARRGSRRTTGSSPPRTSGWPRDTV